ncbi:MAG: 16S rRNA (adenine(1518)-N(6)/adenine(1519)-N(6))-dimethyltransferase RsmA, partial [Sciscionella sp.]
MLGPAEIRRLSEQLSIRPTKRLGQNFVHDANTVRRIVAAAELHPDDVVLEVGPGLGSLTCALLPVARAVHAVEIDPVLAGALRHTVRQQVPGYVERLRVRHADALRLRADELRPAPTAMVANLPYNVAVPLVLHAFAELPSLNSALVMVQAEVADRMVAGPGSRTYGVPSVKTAWYAEVRRAGTVPRSGFWPVPNVDSALVTLRRRPSPPG